MGHLPKLNIKGRRFVLTGRMWTDRKRITDAIHAAGGSVEDRISSGSVLVMASASLVKAADGKWHTRGKTTAKAEQATRMGLLIYHEQSLRQALRTPVLHAALGADPLAVNRADAGDSVRARWAEKTAPEPEWNDELQAKLEANLEETSELLSSF